MNNSSKKGGFDTDLRSMLKHQHKKVYSICRLFAHNYKEHQRLFTDILSAAAQNIRTRSVKADKQVLFLQACINMAALHAITRDMAPSADRSIQFKSPDYQRSMTGLHETVADYSDYEKFRVFLEMEKNAPEALASLTGVAARSRIISKKKEREMEMPKKNFNFIPYIKAKLIWS